jgi:hypothetical protein
VDGSFLVPIDGDLSSAAADDGAFTGGDLTIVVDITLGEIILELFGDVDVFLHVFRRGADAHP